jgi:hypothetical protein
MLTPSAKRMVVAAMVQTANRAVDGLLVADALDVTAPGILLVAGGGRPGRRPGRARLAVGGVMPAAERVTDAEYMAVVGARVRAARLQRGWSQGQLADAVGRHRTFIGLVERAGKRMGLRSVRAIAHELDLPLDVLLAEPSPEELWRRR